MTPPPRLDAGVKAPMAPPTVALKCRTQQGDVRVTDRSERAFYGSCPGVLKVPRGTTPIKLYFHKSGYITWTEEVLPDKDKAVRFLSLTPLRRVSMGRLPDDVIP